MDMSNFNLATRAREYVCCPNCGGCEHDDIRIDETLYVEAAKEAERLKFEGKIDDAIDVLTALFAIRIANFVQPQLECRACGVRFDG